MPTMTPYERTKLWRERNPERLAEHKAKYREKYRDRLRCEKYGLTELEYKALQASQQGLCLICMEFAGDKLAIDHDHETGAVRGLLCISCNSGLGMMKDDPWRLFRAIKYLLYSRKKARL